MEKTTQAQKMLYIESQYHNDVVCDEDDNDDGDDGQRRRTW